MQNMRPEVRQSSRCVYALLAALMEESGEGAIIVEAVTDANGFLAWRNFVREFAPGIADRQVAIYAGLLNSDWHEARNLQQWYKMWLTWEVGMARYMIDTRKTIDDDNKVATLTRCAPDFVRDILNVLPASTSSTYASLRNSLLHVLRQTKVYGPPGVEAECKDDEDDQKPVMPRTFTTKTPLDEAISALSSSPEGKKGNKGKGKGKIEGQLQKLQEQLEQMQAQMQQLLGAASAEGVSTSKSFSSAGSVSENTREAISSGRCFRCGKKGHIAVNCLEVIAELEEDEYFNEKYGVDYQSEGLLSIFENYDNP